MSRTLSVTEPHPSVPRKGAYLPTGRGGAGNYKHYTSSELTSGPTATGPASLVSLTRSTYRRNPSTTTSSTSSTSSNKTTHIPSGRGGAGNFFTRPTFHSEAYDDGEQAMFQFDEEMLRSRETQAPVYHIGRGGGGNVVVDEAVMQRRRGVVVERMGGPIGEKARAGSTASTESGGSDASERSTGSMRRGVEGAWGRLGRKWRE